VLEDFEIEHSSLGWKKFGKRIKPYGSIPFAIETSQGFIVEQLLEAGLEVCPLNPKSAQSPIPAYISFALSIFPKSIFSR
jgi:hypothetical protein